MQLSYRDYHIFKDMDNQGLVIDIEKGLMGNRVVRLDQDTSWTMMTWSKVENGWICLIGEVVVMGFIPVLF